MCYLKCMESTPGASTVNGFKNSIDRHFREIHDILEQLKWKSLKKRRTGNRLILLYKGMKGKARIHTDDLIPKTRRCRRSSHSMAFRLPSASIEAYKCSFLPQTIRDWNDLPGSLLSTSEMSDYCVFKFASLVRSME